MKHPLPILVVILLLLALGSWAMLRITGDGATLVIVQSEPQGIMGTDSKLMLVTERSRSAAARRHLDAAEAELRQLEAQLSTWIEASAISRFNAAPAGQRLTPGPEVTRILTLARQFHIDTRGAFDITARPMIELWRQAGDNGSPPSIEALRVARAESNWGQIHQVTDGIVKDLPTTRVDVDGIAKGWAIDRALEELARAGAAGGMVEVGGDLRLFGTGPQGRPWTVAIQSPFADVAWGEIEPGDGAVCSSGDYARPILIDGHHFSHIIDPRTGRPTERTHAVTVLGPDAATADAWATALSILGVEGLDLLLPGSGLEAMIVTGDANDHQVTSTPGFRRRIVQSDFSPIERAGSGS